MDWDAPMMKNGPDERALRGRILDLLGQLTSCEFNDLLFLLAIPREQQPPDTLPVQDRKQAVLRWADEESNGLQALANGLRSILSRREATNAEARTEALTKEHRDRFGTDRYYILKYLLLGDEKEAPKLREGRFLLTTFVQITGSAGPVIHDGSNAEADERLLDTLAEKKNIYELLMLVHLCKKRSLVLNLYALAQELEAWLSTALDVHKTTIDHVEGCCSGARGWDVSRPPAPSVEIAWRRIPDTNHGHVVAEAYLRWGRGRERLPTPRNAALTPQQVIASVVNRLEGSSSYGDIPLERLDVFVEKAQLNGSWEYDPERAPEDEGNAIYQWPTVVRIQRRECDRRQLACPPDKFDEAHIACAIGQCDSLPREAKKKGAFFAAWSQPVDESVLWKVVSQTAVGCWLRSSPSVASAKQILQEFNDESVPLTELPVHVHKKRRNSQEGSAWREISVLYDHPDLEPFRFSEDAYDDQSKLRTYVALT